MCRSSRGVHSCGSSPAASTTFRKERRTCEASAGVPTREGNTRSFSCHHVERITPPEAIATRLGLDPRADICVVRRHVRYIDGKPAIISDDYFDERIVRGTELAEPEDTTREDILKEAGYEQVYDIDEVITRMPTPAERAGPSGPAPTLSIGAWITGGVREQSSVPRRWRPGWRGSLAAVGRQLGPLPLARQRTGAGRCRRAVTPHPQPGGPRR